jgi:uncharacterized protein YndB with AHSA1/START domain
MRVTRDVVLTVGTAVAWQLLTDPDELPLWLGPRPFTLDHVEEGRELGFVWSDDAGVESRVVITVDEDASGSKVTVTETRASVAGGVRRLAIGAAWDGRLRDFELRSLLREPALV